jgi:hypothetical protein
MHSDDELVFVMFGYITTGRPQRIVAIVVIHLSSTSLFRLLDFCSHVKLWCLFTFRLSLLYYK